MCFFFFNFSYKVNNVLKKIGEVIDQINKLPEENRRAMNHALQVTNGMHKYKDLNNWTECTSIAIMLDPCFTPIREAIPLPKTYAMLAYFIENWDDNICVDDNNKHLIVMKPNCRPKSATPSIL